MLSFFLAAAISAPWLLFDKKVEEFEGKVGDPVHVVYTITNIGDSQATDLKIEDAGVTRDDWKIIGDADGLKWPSIRAGQTITHIFTAIPKVRGDLRMEPSRIDFLADGQQQTALSNTIFWFTAHNTRSIGAKSNLSGYFTFLVTAAIAIVVPLFGWVL